MGVAGAAVLLVGALVGAQLFFLGDGRRWVQRASVAIGGPAGRARRVGRQWVAKAATSRRFFVATIAAGAVLRLLWVIWATRAAVVPADPAEYVRIAEELAHGDMPTFGGLDHSAFWPPGYPAVLAPFVWVADQTGWISSVFTASLVNVVAGTITIWLTGVLAARWIGPRARNPAAALVALGPALIYFTSTAHTETVFTAVLLGAIALCGVAQSRGGGRWWLLVGLVAAFAFLIRSPGLMAFLLPAVTIRAASGSWAGAVQATARVLLGAAVLLVPWTIRNGVQVGVWSPGSTNNAAAACLAHHDGTHAQLAHDQIDVDLQLACYRSSPYDDPRLDRLYGPNVPEGVTLEGVDEPRWYRENLRDAAGWAVSHPVDEVRLSAERLWVMWHNEGRAVDSARNYSEHRWAGRWDRPLDVIADVWLWGVEGMALLGVALVRTCRRAAPIWLPIVLLTAAIAVGPAETHYRSPVVPLVAVLAAGFLVRNTLEEQRP